MFYVDWISNSKRRHSTKYSDPFKAVLAFRKHKRAVLSNANGTVLAQKK